MLCSFIDLAIPDPRDGDQSFEDLWGGDIGKCFSNCFKKIFNSILTTDIDIEGDEGVSPDGVFPDQPLQTGGNTEASDAVISGKFNWSNEQLINFYFQIT